MREILFRGKANGGCCWVYGHYAVLNDGYRLDWKRHYLLSGELRYNDQYGKEDIGKVEIDPNTLGQYTGLKDKNGKRIFEGDIIKTHYANTPKADFVEQVAFHNGRFCGMYERDKMKMWAMLPDGIKRLPMDKSVYMEWCEVIGNIHDNPELIGGVSDENA